MVLDWLTETTLYLPPFKGVVPTQHSSILGVGPYCGLTAYIEARCQGVFKNKGEAPWAITRAEKLQLSVFLPNDLSLDDWYAGVYALPTVWPDVSMLGANNLRRVVGYDFHRLRKKYDVPSVWGNIHPQWRLLQQHLEPKGLVGTRSLREKSGFLPTGLIGLEMI